MSLRYTGEATMDEPALRDVERWKDKIEVRLDNRQVFFLFFGSAMVACMLFVLGVIVGKRLESRGRAEAPVIEDPLAALDRFSAPASATPAGAGLAFPRALLNNAPLKGEHLAARPTLTTGLPALPRKSVERSGERSVERSGERTVERSGEKSAERAERSSERAERPGDRSKDKAVLAAATPAEDAPVTTREAPTRKVALVESPASPARKTAPAEGPVALPAVKKADKADKASLLPHPVATASLPAARPAPGAAPATPKAAALAARPATVAAKTAPVPTAKTAPLTAKVPPAPPAHAPGKGNFLLQLSSFQDRAEADAFARRFSGQNAYVVASEVPGKGLWYRVRVGSYGTMKDAAAAKTAFEREHGVIAYVAGTGPAQ